MPQKLITIDIARGLAALFVFAYHYGVSPVLRQAINYPGFDAISIIGSTYAVPLFFAISGFCIHLSSMKNEETKDRIQRHQKFNYREYISRRFWRIYPTYFIALLFSCALQAMEGNTVELYDFLIHLTLLQSFSVESFNSLNLVLWTISVEFLFYLLYPFWLYIRDLIGLDLSVALGISISVVSWAVCAIWLYPYSLPEKWFVLNVWGAWLTGAWLAEKSTKNSDIFRRPIWWITCISVVSIVVFLKELGFFANRGEIAWASIVTMLWIYPLSASILVDRKLHYFLLHNCKPSIELFKQCGQISYSLYLLHMPLMYVRNLTWINIHSGTTRALIWLLGFFAILGISWISYQVFELPYIKYRSYSKRLTN